MTAYILKDGTYNPNVNGTMVQYNSDSDLINGFIYAWDNMSALSANPYEILIDMGKELRFGYKGGDSSLLVFRRVQRTTGSAASGGVGGGPLPVYTTNYDTYWTVVENKLSASTLFNANTTPTPATYPVTVTRI